MPVYRCRLLYELRSCRLNSTTPTPPALLPRFLQLYREDAAAIRAELAAGLLAPHAALAPKFLYDALGSTLFEAITLLPEYYPTRTEAAIFTKHQHEMAAAIGRIGTLVDLGAGSCEKASRLLPVLKPARYVAVDISVDFLGDALARLQRVHPGLETWGVGLDFSQSLALPADCVAGRPVFFYPGSSIGNFSPDQALSFLGDLRRQARGGGLLVGIDLVKPAAVLQAAYDDALGVTAAFNLNLLRHLNHLLGSDFEPTEWQHVALFNEAEWRIEMHLRARRDVQVRWPGGERRFAAGEQIHTENSHKYTAASFATLLGDAGLKVQSQWTDERGWFAVFWATAAA